MEVELLDAGRRTEAARAWRRLEVLLPEAGLFPSWAWTELWLDFYGDAVEHWFALGRRGTEPAGASLVTRRRRRVGGMTINELHLGTAGEPPGEGLHVERNRPLVAVDDRVAFAAGLESALARLPGWHRIHLHGVPEADAGYLLDVLSAPELRIEPSPCTALTRDEDVLDVLGSGTRARVRRSDKEYGGVEGRWAETPQEGHAVLDELIALHEARWHRAGEPGAFASPRSRAFHHATLDRLVPRGDAVAFRAVDGAGTTIGCLLGHVDGDRLCFYQSGLAEPRSKRCKPGLSCHVSCMREAAARGLAAYDFLGGDARYKRELATATESLVWAVAWRAGPRAAAVRAAQRLRRRLRGDPAAKAP